MSVQSISIGEHHVIVTCHTTDEFYVNSLRHSVHALFDATLTRQTETPINTGHETRSNSSQCPQHDMVNLAGRKWHVDNRYSWPSRSVSRLSWLRVVTKNKQWTLPCIRSVQSMDVDNLSGKTVVCNWWPTLHIWTYLSVALHMSRAALDTIKHSVNANSLPHQATSSKQAIQFTFSRQFVDLSIVSQT